MATNKHAVIRYQALDKCFRNTGRKYFIDDLVDACNNEIYNYNGSSEGVQKRQVYEDINFMQSESGYNAPIEKEKEGRKVLYRYSNSNFTINKQPLNESEAQELKETLLTFNRFKGLPQFEWVEEMSARLEASFQLGTEVNQVMEFEQNPFLKGTEFIKELYHSIINKKVVSIVYQSFKSEEEITIELHPYFLKQYNNRWFLFGKNPIFENLTNLALDRMVSVKQISKKFISSELDFQDYFEDIVGVTFKENVEPIKILLRIQHSLWPYIDSKPLHGSQKVVTNAENYTDITIEVIPNYELESLLLQFGENIKVMQPEDFKDKMHSRIQEMIKNYNSAD